MVSRRTFLQGALAIPATAAYSPNSRIEFCQELHPLALESASGYRTLSKLEGTGSGIIAPAMREISPRLCARLLDRVRGGSWLLLESGVCFSSNHEAETQAKVLNEAFGLEIQPPTKVTQPYISYSWPVQKFVRSFEAVTPVQCHPRDVIARLNDVPICAKKSFGRGLVIYLGSMLGPGLFAEEREAHIVADAMLTWR